MALRGRPRGRPRCRTACNWSASDTAASGCSGGETRASRGSVLRAVRPPQPTKPSLAPLARSQTPAIGPLPTSVVATDAIRDFVGAEGTGERAALWGATRQLERITGAQLRLCGG